MNYILYAAESSVTGKALLDAMKEQGVAIRGGSKVPDGALDTLIRWGSMAKVPTKPKRVVNRLDAIQQASNKREALKIMKAAGINVPLVLTPSEVKPEHLPVLGRKDKHVGANDIILCMQQRDVERAKAVGCTHFSQYIPTKAEYRAHVFGDTIIKISQKILTDEAAATQPWIRNLSAGYTFRQPETRLTGAARGMAIDAVHSLGLTFGAVDIIIGDNDQPYILEVNTAPGLQTDTSLDAYLEQFRAAIK